MTVIAFIIMPGKTNSFNVESLRGQAVTKQLRDTVREVQEKIGHKIFETALSGKLPEQSKLIGSDDMVKMKRCLYLSQRTSLPPICTHNVQNDSEDLVLGALRRCQLFNNSSDRVKVIFHPEFLSSTSPLLPLDYDEFVRGCHLGVFPSYYEPWGYTPAECTVMGIPSVTTNLSGFGCFIYDHVVDPQSFGIYIVDRQYRSADESTQQLTQCMFDFCKLTRRQRIIQRNRTERLSDILDWRNLGIYYVKARLLGLHRRYPDRYPVINFMDAGRKTPSVSRPASAHGSPSMSRSSSPPPSTTRGDVGRDEDVDDEAAARGHRYEDATNAAEGLGRLAGGHIGGANSSSVGDSNELDATPTPDEVGAAFGRERSLSTSTDEDEYGQRTK